MNRKTTLSWIALLLTAIAGAASAQVRMGLPEETEPKYEFLSKSGVVTIPFELINNHIVIPVSVHGSEPFRMILDTGMPVGGVVLYESERVDALELAYGDMKVLLGGVGGDSKPREAKVAPSVALTLDGLRIEEQTVIVAPAMSQFDPYHEGIIGKALFGTFVVRIDFDQRQVRMYGPGGLPDAGDAAGVPLTFQHNLTFIAAAVETADGVTLPVELVVDTGASHTVSLNFDSSDKLSIPERSIETVIGRGMTGDVTGHVGRIRSLTLGGQVLRNVVATFPDSPHQSIGRLDTKNGNLGSGLLRRFNVTFDYAGDRMLLEPSKAFRDPFEWDMSGLRVRESDARGVWVEAVLPGSPAEKAGVKADDIVTHVNDKPAGELGAFGIKELLKQDGKKLSLRVRRGSEELTFEIRLRRLV